MSRSSGRWPARRSWKTVSTDSTTPASSFTYSRQVRRHGRLQDPLQRRHDGRDTALRRDGTAPSSEGLAEPARHRGRAARSGRLYYRGNVDPGWGRKPITIQRKACASDRCPWHAYKTGADDAAPAPTSVKISVPPSGRLVLALDRQADLPTFVRGYGVPYYTTRSRMPARVGFGH